MAKEPKAETAEEARDDDRRFQRTVENLLKTPPKPHGTKEEGSGKGPPSPK